MATPRSGAMWRTAPTAGPSPLPRASSSPSKSARLPAAAVGPEPRSAREVAGGGRDSTSPAVGDDPRAGAASVSPGPKRPFGRLLDPHRHSVSSFYTAAEEDLAGVGLDGSQTLHTLSSWTEEMPQAILFPANKPSSRVDAAILDQWISTSFASYAQRCMNTGGSEEDLTRAVEELVPIVSIGLHEIVRQATQHCLERGVVLEKIWRTYVDLFERALKEAKSALQRQKEKASRVQAELDKCKEELAQMQRKHPQQIEKLAKTLHTKFAQRQSVLEDQLRTLHTENGLLSGHLETSEKNAKCWFPLFDLYKSSELKQSLVASPPVMPPSSSPEARISADMKRILLAMPPEGRRRVGFYISSLLGLRSTQLPSDTTEALMERRDHNRWKIEQLEQRLAELKATAVVPEDPAPPPKGRRRKSTAASAIAAAPSVASAESPPLATGAAKAGAAVPGVGDTSGAAGVAVAEAAGPPAPPPGGEGVEPAVVPPLAANSGDGSALVMPAGA